VERCKKVKAPTESNEVKLTKGLVMLKRLTYLVATLAVLVSAGCHSTSVSNYERKNPDVKPEIIQAMTEHIVKVGMNKEQVRITVGKPDKENNWHEKWGRPWKKRSEFDPNDPLQAWVYYNYKHRATMEKEIGFGFNTKGGLGPYVGVSSGREIIGAKCITLYFRGDELIKMDSIYVH